MKRFSKDYKFPCDPKVHMASRLEDGKLVIIPANEDWQLMFDFMIGW